MAAKFAARLDHIGSGEEPGDMHEIGQSQAGLLDAWRAMR
jgi:hypothetical protein